MKKIYPKEWLHYHPYSKIDAVDRYYCNVVNRVMKVLYEHDILGNDALPEERVYENTAIFIAAWFEDVISQTGVWQVFTSQCEKRYGSRLPFYELNNTYYYDEINVEDIRFILWHCFQSKRFGVKIYNPENLGLKELSEEIYNILDDEYETAPENERLQEFFDFSHLTEDDFLMYRNKVDWFYMNSYINIGCYEDFMDTMAEQIEKLEEEEDMDVMTAEIKLYSHKVNTILLARTPLLAITAPEYIKLIQEFHPASPDAPYMNIDAVNESLYLVESETDKYFVFKSLSGDKAYYKVTKDSLDLKSNKLVPGDTLVTSTLVKYGEYWSHNGAMMNYSISQNPGMKKKIKELEALLSGKNEEKTFKDFIKATKGKRIVFFKDTKEMIQFIEKKVKYKNTLDFDFSSLGDDSIMLSATREKGLCFMNNLCECVASPDNPYYNQEKAQKHTIYLLTYKDSIPYEVACYLLDSGYLKDAGLNSLLGAEHGRELVSKNAQFIMDYFFKNCREKDYNF